MRYSINQFPLSMIKAAIENVNHGELQLRQCINYVLRTVMPGIRILTSVYGPCLHAMAQEEVMVRGPFVWAGSVLSLCSFFRSNKSIKVGKNSVTLLSSFIRPVSNNIYDLKHFIRTVFTNEAWFWTEIWKSKQ